MKRFQIESIIATGSLLFLVVSINFRPPNLESELPLIVHARPVPPDEREITAPEISPTNRSVFLDSRVKFLPRHDLRWEQSPPEAAFARFAEWVTRYRDATALNKIVLEAEGSELARERREALRSLIQSNPARALALAVPLEVQGSLPDAVKSLLEERVSGRGSLAVFGALAEPGHEDKVLPTFRIATLGGREYHAFVYGRRLGEPTRPNIPLSGISVDNLLAVNENPVRLLEPEEIPDGRFGKSEPLCVVSRNPSSIARTQIAAETGGEPIFFCAPAHAAQLNEELIQAEAAGESGGGGEVQANAATEGTKKLLLIRIDFSDLAGAPFADSTGIALVNGLDQFYRESSYGRSGFAPCLGLATNSGGSDVTPTLRMPQTASYYGGNDAYLQLRTHARNAAEAAGYVLSNYDYDLYCFGAVPGFHWAGLGYVGWPGVWLRSYFTPGVAGHELGHNYGLNHANFWDTGGQSVIGVGSSAEYGDSFDTMGSANGGACQFNARYKSYINWLRTGEILTVTTSGVYRVFAHDDTNSTGLRGLKIARTSSTNYWVEFRQKFTSNPWLMSGAGIRWAGNGNERSHLLDTTPGSPNGKNDSSLVMGRTFSDSAAGIHITTLRKTGTAPESLDIAVNLGTFPGNVAPHVVVSGSDTSTPSGTPLIFTASASDTDGDTLSYHWDFGDGTFGTNGTIASNTWMSSGEYVVRCVVSDMKGGVASDSVVVTVDSPGTYRISGQVQIAGAPAQGVGVSVSNMKMAYTDSDGTYTLAGLPAGSYTVTAVLDGYSFAASGFTNPVGVGPTANGIDFDAGGAGGGSSGTVIVTSPANNATYTAPATVFLAGSATAGNGRSVSKMEFFQGATKLGEDSAFPYSFTWNNAPAGNYTLSARAVETGGIVVTSAPVTITVNPAAPAITSHPQNQTVPAGASVSFTVTATGSAPLTYRWRFNGTNLVGANSATLSLFNVQAQQAGGYSVVITNNGGAVTSTVANLTVTCGFTLSSSSATFGATGGLGNVSVTSLAGCAWNVGNVPSWIAITSGNGGSGNGTVNYSVAANSTAANRNATLVIGGRNFTVTQAAPDLTRPTVAISFPAAAALLINSQLTVTGTAADNDSLLRVECRVGSGAFVVATGTATWSVPVTVSPGTNVISVRSVDVSGNVSVTNARSVFCAVPATLSLAVTGHGVIKGATNGQALDIGRICKLTASPVAGFVFSNWTGDVSGNSPRLTFLMQSNLAVIANFVTNPFVLAKGQFNGLFYETDEVRVGSAGLFNFKLTDKGTYTASLHLAGKKYPVSGRLSLEGRAINILERPGTTPLTITWAVGLDGSDQITGTVSDASWNAQLMGDRKVFGPANPAPQAGNYTLILLGSAGSTLSPEGDAYGKVSVDSRGIVSLKGSLADKSPIALRVTLSKNGQWPVFTTLYQGKGMLLGWARFADAPTTDFDGVMSWIKPALSTSRRYPAGFTAEAALIGSRFTRPIDATKRVLALTNTVVLLSGGNLAHSFTNDVMLGLGSKVTNASPNSLVMNFTLSSGLFSGSFAPSGDSGTISFKGAVLQKGNYGSGYFLGTNQSGWMGFGIGSLSPVSPLAP